MIEAPSPNPPRIGPLRTPSEEELAEARTMLQNEALTIPWAAERLGIGVARVEVLVRSGELLAIPGPWPMRQAHRSGLGYFVPAWQLDSDAGRPLAQLSTVFDAAAQAGLTSLDLHRFMTARLGADGSSPAQWLRNGDVDRVVSLIRGEPRPPVLEPVQARRFPRFRAAHRPRRPRRHIAA